MGRADPFTGYPILLRIIVYGLIPAFGVWQFVRLRRALHLFQLEGYKRNRFVQWCRANGGRALFLRRSREKKPLVMTGRAWRLLILSTLLSVSLVVFASGFAHVWFGGFPADVVTWAVVTGLVFVGAPLLLVGADFLLTPVQAAINARYLTAARNKLADTRPLVVGITGSFGKTSTKFAIAGLIGDPDTVLATPSSFNTPLGVCRTINEKLGAQKFFVVEMGAYREGDIAELCRFVGPIVGVLTAIGPAHLDRFGSMDAIRRGKYEIVTSLPRDGTAVMNVDDPEVRSLADETTNVSVVRYGLDAAGRPDITARDVTITPQGTTFTLVDTREAETIDVSMRLLGRHAVGHVLAATAVALIAGNRLVDLPPRVAELQPVEHRLQLIEGTGGVTVIDDAYNSNPDGAAAALEVLASMPAKRRVVVTPGIIELGPLQHDANERFGEQAAAVADTLIVVAPVNRDAIVTGARRADSAQIVTVDNLAEATSRLGEFVGPGDVVLFENDLPDQYEVRR